MISLKNISLSQCLLARFTVPMLLATLAHAGENGSTQLESLTQAGLQGSEDAVITDCSPDGRWVVMATESALIPEDTNDRQDVYVRDRLTGAVVCASRNFQGAFGNAAARRGKISADGRYVVFNSSADDLVGFDANGHKWDVFRKDLHTGLLLRVSQPIGSIVAANGNSHHPELTPDGRYVVFQSDATDMMPGASNGKFNIYWRDMEVPTMKRISSGILSEVDGDCWSPFVSGDGSRVAFYSHAGNLVLSDTNGHSDVFVTDVNGATIMVTRDVNGGEADGYSGIEGLSEDGERVLFTSTASNLVASDFNGTWDVFWMDLSVGVIELVSAAPDGLAGDESSTSAVLSADGTSVLFTSLASNLTADGVGVRSAYLHTIDSGATVLVSRPTGVLGLPDDESQAAAISADGSVAFYSSLATNLVPGDLNAVADGFSREHLPDPIAYCTPSTSSAGCQATVASNGAASASNAQPFFVTATNVPNNKPGILFYGLNGADETPFLGGALCMLPPVQRAPYLFSGGNPEGIEDCSGNYTIDMNAFAAGALGGTPALELSVMGQAVQAQFWGRDPADLVHGSFLSDSLEYVVGP